MKRKEKIFKVENMNDFKDKLLFFSKSKENVINGTFPIEKDLIEELSGFLQVLEKYNVNVIRPEIIENYNQIFSRDIAFVIENKIIISGIIDERKKEIDGIKNFFSFIYCY